MLPVSFPQKNAVLGPPKNSPELDCLDLPVYKGDNVHGQPVITSCWKLNKEEIDEIIRTGCFWHTVYGEIHPPVWLSAYNPFIGPVEMLVSNSIVSKTAVDVVEDMQYAFSQLPEACTNLRIEHVDGMSILKADQQLDGYEYHEPGVEVIGLMSEKEGFGHVMAYLSNRGFTPETTVILKRTSK